MNLRFVSIFLLYILVTTWNSGLIAQTLDSSLIDQYITLANQYLENNKFEKSRKYSLKVLDIDSTYGEAYLLIGGAYVNSADSCADNDFMKHMIYCLAVDKFQKAKELDNSLTDKVDRLIDVYSRYFPQEEAFYGHVTEGQKYKINCWINEETTVRFAD
ncbi:MAG TPA: hypothetical protein VJ937_00955 [Salinivirga sp.]|uniref:hypothetical protein n=1 Tax=Salinivirga sp. TaxID=1970192 RepID=UPI002B473366|nr:hypothetical protein [Salinivirga sp.]HKK58019.1 hypothetical protein [Salinivirga sp.]